MGAIPSEVGAKNYKPNVLSVLGPIAPKLAVFGPLPVPVWVLFRSRFGVPAPLLNRARHLRVQSTARTIRSESPIDVTTASRSGLSARQDDPVSAPPPLPGLDRIGAQAPGRNGPQM